MKRSAFMMTKGITKNSAALAKNCILDLSKKRRIQDYGKLANLLIEDAVRTMRKANMSEKHVCIALSACTVAFGISFFLTVYERLL
jgi:hypothetical protein